MLKFALLCLFDLDSAAAVEEYWEEAHDGKVPSMALVAGQDHECELLVARAKHEGDLIPGKLAPAHRSCYVGFDGKEHSKRVYEVLCGCRDHEWVRVNAGEEVPGNAVVAGCTIEGEPLYIGRAEHRGTVQVGKVHPSHGVCYIPYDGKELAFPDYEILVRHIPRDIVMY